MSENFSAGMMPNNVRLLATWSVGCVFGCVAGGIGMAIGTTLMLPEFDFRSINPSIPVSIQSGSLLGGTLFGVTTSFVFRDTWSWFERLRWMTASAIGWSLGIACLDGFIAAAPTMSRFSATIYMAMIAPFAGLLLGVTQLSLSGQATLHNRQWPVATAIGSEVTLMAIALWLLSILNTAGL